MRDMIGTPPIARPFFVAGKLSLVACCLFPSMRFTSPGRLLPAGPAALAAGAFLLAAGLTVLGLALKNLGGSTRMGLPREATALKTGGAYRFSRNPMYLGLFALCLASCCLAPHWVNFMLAAAVIAAHHRIVLAEERFLEIRFGDAWRQYRAKVRRYL